jgi:hypothetical protein
MPLLFYLPLIICTGLFAVAQGETRSLPEPRRYDDRTR